MMNHDDELDRAIFALPLEPLPAGLRASILAAVVASPGPMFRRWEIYGIGAILALGTWLCLLLLNVGDQSHRLLSATAFILARSASDPAMLGWLALGASTAVWLSLVSVPRRTEAARR